jgi:hypothetical protein
MQSDEGEKKELNQHNLNDSCIVINTADDISMLACMWWHSTGRERGGEREK